MTESTTEPASNRRLPSGAEQAHETDVQRLRRGIHRDPHAILGPHWCDEGVVVRLWYPEATTASLLWGDDQPRPMNVLHSDGLFSALVEGAHELPPYAFEITLAGSASRRFADPYRFKNILGELDIHLAQEGRHELLYERLGAHVCALEGVPGVAFAVWAPEALGVAVMGSFNGWEGLRHPMRCPYTTGIWELFIPGLDAGAYYKYEIVTHRGFVTRKMDPYCQSAEEPPGTASIVYQSRYNFADAPWMARRESTDILRAPVSIYEVHLGSWQRQAGEDAAKVSYRELAPRLADYVADLGFTHVELMPVMEHPYGGSWGYQVSAYFAPTARYGQPDDLRYFIDHLHQRGIGVLLDWVPAHFPKDAFALGRFDGTALYEHLDPRQGEHPDWGTYVYNYGRSEVRNFLFANGLYWLKEFHADGLRLDAVASMLCLDYSRPAGEWVPNRFGGRENLDAVAFVRQLNEIAHARFPGVMMVAEESTTWPGVSRPLYVGGLGFGFKWNMGWMNDTLKYFSMDPVYRRHYHDKLTFGLMYAWSENFILPLSHDEVVHGKRSLIGKMPGPAAYKYANLRALLAYMWAHPGKKLLFMGGEIAQWREWNHDGVLDWELLNDPDHRGVQQLVRDLNRVYRQERALWEADVSPSGFRWIDCHDMDFNALAFLRIAPSTGEQLMCVCNFSPVVRHRYRVGVPHPGFYAEILNSDAAVYGGTNTGNRGGVVAASAPAHGHPYSVEVVLPPLAVCWFRVPPAPEPISVTLSTAAAAAVGAGNGHGAAAGARVGEGETVRGAV
ncbi:MAG: 1,4-alpha-glucan branching protein GlgB [Candidatus Schekmanbacteria bacterium]|nr:1,4-alpha-glucan branching protein GlgB [Candidatus Schekmanbacteria bacterium]